MQRASVATRAQTTMVGMTKRDLFMCAGVPERQQQVDDLEFLTYSGGGDTVGAAYARSDSYGNAYAVGRRNRRYCEATIVLRQGVVQQVNYSGRTGGLLSRGEQCAFIVENCVR
jgi:hypothetical protein